MPSEPSHYDLLEVRRDATPTDIEKAFSRQQAKLKSLPTDSAAWRRRRQEVDEAFRVLSDTSAKEVYDRQFYAGGRPLEASGEVEPDMRVVTYIGAPSAEGLIDQAARYKLVLRKAHRTEEGIEIELAPSAWSRTAVAEELRRHVPSAFLRFNAGRNSWTVAGAYEAALRELFLNLDSALNENASWDLQVFSIPQFGDPPASLDPSPKPVEAEYPHKPELRRSRWTATINGTTLGLAGVVLLIGWNLYVAGSQRQQEPVVISQAVVMQPTRTPSPTQTPVPTPVPTPVSFPTTTKFTRVHLRAGPAQSTTSLGFLLEDEEFTAVGRTANGEWIRIVKGDMTGWSAAWTLNVEERLDELPVLEP